MIKCLNLCTFNYRSEGSGYISMRASITTAIDCPEISVCCVGLRFVRTRENVCDGACMLLQAVRACAALVGTIIQLERHKGFLPKLKQKTEKKALT